jgi:uncharacterized RDD family membrane protein YckC
MIKGSEMTGFSFSFYLNPLIYLFNLIAILQFVISRFKRSALLRIFLQYTIFSFFVFFPIWTINSFFQDHHYGQQVLAPMFFFKYAMSAIITAFNVFALRHLMITVRPKLIPFGNGTNTFDEASKWQRFFHRIFDLSVIALVVYPSFEYISRFIMEIFDSSNLFLSFIGQFLQLGGSFYILIYVLITLYYLTTEGIFNTSIGKTILGNVVANNIAEKPSVGQRIGRTFARLIPFEVFSFLFIPRGWHDSLTTTYVVKAEKDSDHTTG